MIFSFTYCKFKKNNWSLIKYKSAEIVTSDSLKSRHAILMFRWLTPNISKIKYTHITHVNLFDNEVNFKEWITQYIFGCYIMAAFAQTHWL